MMVNRLTGAYLHSYIRIENIKNWYTSIRNGFLNSHNYKKQWILLICICHEIPTLEEVITKKNKVQWIEQYDHKWA